MADGKTEVFIVRVWMEPRDIEGAPVLWRAAIEHVPSGNRRYLEKLDDLPAVIAQYLQDKA